MKAIVLIFTLLTTSLSLAQNLEIIQDTKPVKIDNNMKYKWGMDPFLKYPGIYKIESKTADVLNLEGILYDEEDPIAIINGITVGESSLINNYRVNKIGTNYVILKKGLRTKQLVLPYISPEEVFEEPIMRTLSSDSPPESESKNKKGDNK